MSNANPGSTIQGRDPRGSLPLTPGYRRVRSGLAVIDAQVVDDRLRVFGADRRAEDLDHLGHATVPAVAVEKRRIHDDIVETVAGPAVRLDLCATRPILQLETPLLRDDDAGGHRQREQQTR